MMLFPDSIYSADQEEFWQLDEEYREIASLQHQPDALYDWELLIRIKEHEDRVIAFAKKNRGKFFRVFRLEDIEAAVDSSYRALKW